MLFPTWRAGGSLNTAPTLGLCEYLLIVAERGEGAGVVQVEPCEFPITPHSLQAPPLQPALFNLFL